MIRRVYVEKKAGFRQETERFGHDLKDQLRIASLESVRKFLRYDVEGVPEEIWESARGTVFSEPMVDDLYDETLPEINGAEVFGVEYLPGQYDQRADSSEQCLRLLADCEPLVACAEIFVLEGELDPESLDRIKAYTINPVDSREAAMKKPSTLKRKHREPASVERLEGFHELDETGLKELRESLGLAMTLDDLGFCQQYFRDEAVRVPSITEIKLLDTYWSDHCRHTTFLTEIQEVSFDEAPGLDPVKAAWNRYLNARKEVYGDRLDERPICLMDIALMGMKSLRKAGKLGDLEESDEVNAASIVVPVKIDGREEEWLVQFKNETHNHPTEIEPFGGAATCLGGAIRDPLSGRSYVYQAMRVTGCADPRALLDETLPGKLPQGKITREAAEGYSSYGNQIGLATGLVTEVYHPKYVAKRMEIGAVIAASPRANVTRGSAADGDVILLVGGRTGRDGIGGATGSSKEHTETALENSAEVQKGDPTMERKLQRLFRIPEVSRSIKICNDFGAGGVSVAIGELAPSLDIDLDAVPLKYAGLDGTEIALSESQERMAVVVDPKDVEAFVEAAAAENLEATEVARVTDSGRLRMNWRGDCIVDIERRFLDSNGVRQRSNVHVKAPDFEISPFAVSEDSRGERISEGWKRTMEDLNVCSQRGLVERFDSTIGMGSVLHPFGGRERSTPTEVMAAKLPTLAGEPDTGTLMTFGFHPQTAEWSPFHGALYAVVESVARIISAGGKLDRIRLTLQEYFERLREDPSRWGKPFAALLGAWTAQDELGVAAIGGKDSMSGSFRDLDVPPTLVSFAVCPVPLANIISPEFKSAGSRIVIYTPPTDSCHVPHWESLKNDYIKISDAIEQGHVLAAHSIREGGAAAAMTKMGFGNRIGIQLQEECSYDTLFGRFFGGLVMELAENAPEGCVPGEFAGMTLSSPEIQVDGERLSLDELRQRWELPLESVFPTRAENEQSRTPSVGSFQPHKRCRAKTPVARPRVFIPTFPGTNCEWDSAKAFQKAGANPEIQVFRNRNHADIEASLEALVKGIDQSQILFLPGGFSAGDEPAGSGKFIASVFRNSRVTEATMRLLYDRKGLILGICNGFQALMKLGLLPYGEIRKMDENSPTLTYNTLGRHVSTYARTRVVSRLSPWLELSRVEEEYLIPLSHGEGRFVASEDVLQSLFQSDQIATQYVDGEGSPSMDIHHNPNGSLDAIEGITSPCGRVFGKMGHSEREGPFVGINLHGALYQPVFESGVRYFS